MYVAYTSMNQEDEHSCFSDNTHRDIILNAKGIYNIYTGTYVRTDMSVVTGDALEDLMALINSGKNAELLTLLNDSQTATNAIYVPFDQAIVLSAERPKVLDAVNKLQAEGNKIVEIAALLGITITL
jgi:putative iron-regulated protein